MKMAARMEARRKAQSNINRAIENRRQNWYELISALEQKSNALHESHSAVQDSYLAGMLDNPTPENKATIRNLMRDIETSSKLDLKILAARRAMMENEDPLIWKLTHG